MKQGKGNGCVDLVVVGSIGIDTIETPLARQEEILGGSVSYACSAASFFTEVGMVGVVGDDFPAEYTELYAGFGIDLAGLQRAPGKTFRWSGVYEADMINRRTLSTDLNVFADFEPVLPANYRRAPFFLLGNISPELQLHVLSQAEDAQFVVADTMDLWINTAHDALMELVPRIDMLTVNDGEARLLTGEWNLKRCAARILDWGPRYVIVKKGEHGAMLCSKSGVFMLPGYPVDEVRDPTGAGDAFAGGLMGALARAGTAGERDLRAAMLFGTVVASFGVEEFSLGRLRNLSVAEIEARTESLKSMIRVDLVSSETVE
jgi:sugar/nucleoside kinase (ribokinase family)